MPADRAATVWWATFVPSKSPIPEFGQDGYHVAWVDTEAGREQILVDGARPEPGARGRIVVRRLGESSVEMFVEHPA